MTHTGKKVSAKKKALVMPAEKAARGEVKSAKAGTHDKRTGARTSSAEKVAPKGKRLTGIARRAFHAHEGK